VSTWLDDADFQSRARDAEDDLCGGEMHRCPVCGGSGEVRWNPSRDGNPEFEESAECRYCDGQGGVEVDA
jgi:DnaJ-class molecular chaperone